MFCVQFLYLKLYFRLITNSSDVVRRRTLVVIFLRCVALILWIKAIWFFCKGSSSIPFKLLEYIRIGCQFWVVVERIVSLHLPNRHIKTRRFCLHATSKRRPVHSCKHEGLNDETHIKNKTSRGNADTNASTGCEESRLLHGVGLSFITNMTATTYSVSCVLQSLYLKERTYVWISNEAASQFTLSKKNYLKSNLATNKWA